MREKIPIATAGFKSLSILATVTGICYWSYKPYAFLPAALLLFTAYFFRNPLRKIDRDPDNVLSPADGVVMSVARVYEDRYMHQWTIKISIFLSLFNVHINRSPVEGKVAYTRYVPGKFIPAFRNHASEHNERNYIGIESGEYRILVSQVSGFLARKIVCYSRPGDILNQGQQFGMIKFGSCTEIYLPEDFKPTVQPGDRVKGGKTVVGRLSGED